MLSMLNKIFCYKIIFSDQFDVECYDINVSYK